MPSFSRGVVDDPDVRLVRDVDVDVRRPSGRPRRAARSPTSHEHARRELEHLAAVHPREVLAGGDRLARGAACASRLRRGRAPSRRSRRRRARSRGTRLGRLARCTTAPAPSPNSTHVARSDQSTTFERRSRADDERAAADPGGEHRVRLRERVDETRAPGREIVGARLRRARAGRRQRRRRRKRHVRRHRGDDDEVEILRRAPCAARAPPGQRAGRSRTTPRPGRPHGARGCPSAPRSTRPTCRPSPRARRSSPPARAPTSRGR